MHTASPIELSPYVACQECRREFPRRAHRCPACGTANRPPKPPSGAHSHCYQCGHGLSRKTNVCGECGYAH